MGVRQQRLDGTPPPFDSFFAFFHHHPGLSHSLFNCNLNCQYSLLIVLLL